MNANKELEKCTCGPIHYLKTTVENGKCIFCKKPSPSSKEKCEKCNGEGWYTYTTTGTPHGKPCEVCCKHDKGFWMLSEHYSNAGELCCMAGCGFTKPDDGTGIIPVQPETTPSPQPEEWGDLEDTGFFEDMQKLLDIAEKKSGTNIEDWNNIMTEAEHKLKAFISKEKEKSYEEGVNSTTGFILTERIEKELYNAALSDAVGVMDTRKKQLEELYEKFHLDVDDHRLDELSQARVAIESLRK